MKIAFYGGETAGLIVLLTMIAKAQNIQYVIPEDEKVGQVAEDLHLKVLDKSFLDDEDFLENLKDDVDLFICCHGKKILSARLVNSLKCINLHPCLYKYKGAKPIARLIAEGNTKASVASHWMTNKVDSGETIVEIFKEVHNVSDKSEAEVYNELYSLYCKVIIKTLEKILPL